MTKQILHTVEGLRDIHPLDTRKNNILNNRSSMSLINMDMNKFKRRCLNILISIIMNEGHKIAKPL